MSIPKKEIYRDRKAFSVKVFEVASTDLLNMGIFVVSYTLKDIRDRDGYLKALGMGRTAQVKRWVTCLFRNVAFFVQGCSYWWSNSKNGIDYQRSRSWAAEDDVKVSIYRGTLETTICLGSKTIRLSLRQNENTIWEKLRMTKKFKLKRPSLILLALCKVQSQKRH